MEGKQRIAKEAVRKETARAAIAMAKEELRTCPRGLLQCAQGGPVIHTDRSKGSCPPPFSWRKSAEQGWIQDFPKGGANDGKGEGVCPLPRKAEKLLPLLLKINRPDFVPFRRKSMSEIRMKAFRGILLILM